MSVMLRVEGQGRGTVRTRAGSTTNTSIIVREDKGLTTVTAFLGTLVGLTMEESIEREKKLCLCGRTEEGKYVIKRRDRSIDSRTKTPAPKKILEWWSWRVGCRGEFDGMLTKFPGQRG